MNANITCDQQKKKNWVRKIKETTQSKTRYLNDIPNDDRMNDKNNNNVHNNDNNDRMVSTTMEISNAVV